MRLFSIIISFISLIITPQLTKAQPDYIIPLNKPAKYKNRTLRSEKSDDKKFTISRRVYQGMVTHYNYYYNANLKIENILAKAKMAHKDDFTELLPFYNYSPALTVSDSSELDSIIYKASAGIVLHDLRNSYIDNLYLLAGRAYFYWQKFDSAYRIFQFVNYRFYPKEKGEYAIVVGGNKKSSKGELNVSTKEKNNIIHKAFSRPPSRNDALLWIARTYAEDSLLAEAAALCHLLKKDRFFPKRLHNSLDEVLAYVYYRQEKWDSTAFYLRKALPNATNKTDLARWEYLLGQLYSKLNKPSEAASFYAKSKKHTPDPVLHIYARIYEAQIVKGQDLSSTNDTYDELLKLTKKERFDGFEDVLFYAAAGMALNKKDSLKAISLLNKSTQYNTTNTELKNKTYLKLAEIYFKQKKYTFASSAYDSLNLQDQSLSKQSAQIEERKKILNDLVKQMQIVQKEDSLQRIAGMNEKDRYLFLKKLLKALRKQKGIKETERDIVYNPSPTGNNANTDGGIFIQTANTGGWYFNNNSQKAKGYTEFKSKWGKRPNVDNWRRQSAIDAINIQQTPFPGNPGGIDGDIDQVKVNVNQDINAIPADEQELSIQSLESDLPLTDTLMFLSNKKIEEALLQKAWVYKNQLEDYPLCIETLEELLRRFPNSSKENDILKDLVYAYKKTGNTQQYNNYLKQLNEKFPEAEKPASASAKQETNPNRTYENIYRLFQQGEYTKAAAQKRIADSIYGKKYWTPQLLYIEAVNQIKQHQDSAALATLAYIETNYSGTEIAGKAATLKEVVSRREEIEAYLSNTNIVKNEEKKLTTPYEEAQEIQLLAKPYIIPRIQLPAITTLPNQIIHLQKPRAGIEIAGHQFVKKSLKPEWGLIKKAGADSIYLTPLKNTYTDMVYVYNVSEPYFFLLIFEDIDPVYKSEAKIAFERFNSKARGGEDIVSQLYEPKDGLSWLQVGIFPALASSLGYYDDVAANIKTIIPWLPSEKYQLLIISEKNMETFKSRKDVSEYLLFIRQYVKNKF
ncbi:MAG: tetratricopeptide repeat protein [Bacteroidota bacterium]